jgi:integrase
MKLLEQMRQEIRVRHYSIRTERAYIDWVKRYIYFHNKQHPNEMGEQAIRQFINWLATTQKVAASTQNQALCAVLFLYKQVLKKDVEWVEDIVWAKRPRKLPVVFSRAEISRIIPLLTDVHWLIAQLMYGSGLRLKSIRQSPKIPLNYQQFRNSRWGSHGLSFCIVHAGDIGRKDVLEKLQMLAPTFADKGIMGDPFTVWLQNRWINLMDLFFSF